MHILGKKHIQQTVQTKLDIYLKKKEIGFISSTLYKNQFKMDQKPQCETKILYRKMDTFPSTGVG